MSNNSRLYFLISSIILSHTFYLEAKPSKNSSKDSKEIALDINKNVLEKLEFPKFSC